MCPCGQNDNDFAAAVWMAALLIVPAMVLWRQWPRCGWSLRASLVLACGAVMAGGIALSYYHGNSGGSTDVCPVAVETPDSRPADSPLSPPQAAAGPVSAPAEAEAPSGSSLPEVVAYYFHRTIRCHSCLQIEEWARETIEGRFADEVANGIVAWRAVNMDEPTNRHFEEEFDLTAQSLVLARLEGGKATEWKNLAGVWERLGDYARFTQYVQDELSSFVHASATTR